MNVAEKLAREIWRVAGIYRTYQQIVEPGDAALVMIGGALEQACKAFGYGGDQITMIVAVQDLEGIHG